jgi:Tetratricopeptide repeat
MSWRIGAWPRWGQVEPARTLGEDALQRCHHLAGVDRPHRRPGRARPDGGTEAARALGEDTLPRCRRVLGTDHPITLGAAAVLTGALAGLGEVEAARALSEDTLPRCLRTLGPDHLIMRSLTGSP